MSESIERVDPSTLIIAANVRTETKISKEFVASIKQHGVKVPITVQRIDEGLAVIDGQRRTLAAVDAGLADVPVFVVEPLSDEKDRIVDQLIVNDQRESLGAVETAAAVKQLELFGMTATAIARKTGYKREHVNTALAVGSSEAASTALREHQVSFDDAAIIAEFEGDAEAQSELVQYAASGYNLRHSAQQWRDKRAQEALEATIEAMEGVTLIGTPSYDQADPKSVHSLYLDEARRDSLNEVEHERLVELAGDGLCAYVQSMGWSSEGQKFEVRYAIKGWKERGLFGYEYGSTKPTTPEEVEALKQQRRLDRQTTKDWASATTVRIAWLAELAQRKTMPKGWELEVARHVVSTASTNFSPNQWAAVAAILQVPEGTSAYSRRDDVSAWLEQHPARAPHAAVAIAFGAIEGRQDFDRKGWQAHDAADRIRRYLLTLHGWGYLLSEVEARVAGAEHAAAA
ncbi:ParB family chromosome partitioning protein [Frigoribacterium sp. PhB160]|uniref:ParB/RepB/Spo0J family partition protein n=1 Tax=Frigoribacterium sp. PhB160 TaxID=2485192 RepID=UPI000F48A0AA|nr:ParB/RepB/Spo0J family partition protein [Frigoribacterium sp. PhB160]ROS62179.1 ParB family chromosome partitioning protein [Frigoribacterium sp. PhB160]